MNKARTNLAPLLAALLGAVLLAPAAAGSAGDSSGALSVAGSPSFFGTLNVRTSSGAIFIDGGSSQHGPAWTGEAAVLRARRVVIHQNATDDLGAGPVGIGSVSHNDVDVHFFNATGAVVAIRDLETAHELVLAPDPQDGVVWLAGEEAELPLLGHLARDFAFRRGSEARDWSFAENVPHGALAIASGDANLTDTFRPHAERIRAGLDGDGRIYVRGGTVTIEAADGDVTWSTGVEEPAAKGGPRVVVQRTVTFVVLEMWRAAIAGELGDDAGRLLARHVDVHVDGEMTFAAATGRIRDGAGSHRLQGASGAIEGNFVAQLAMRHGPDLPMVTHRYPISQDQQGVITEAALAGHLRLATLNGRGLDAAPLTLGLTTDVAAGAGIGLGILALAWGLQKAFVALGGFARPPPAHPVLENALRSRLHGLVQTHPGIHSRRLQGMLGVTSGTFFHHVRVLLGANLVARRRIGSRVVYVAAAPGVAPAGHELRARSALTTDARRRIALALAQGPKTQREISEAVGVPQQNVSFHLKALVDRGVVTAGERRPQVYVLRREYAAVVHEMAAVP